MYLWRRIITLDINFIAIIIPKYMHEIKIYFGINRQAKSIWK